MCPHAGCSESSGSLYYPHGLVRIASQSSAELGKFTIFLSSAALAAHVSWVDFMSMQQISQEAIGRRVGQLAEGHASSQRTSRVIVS